MSLSIVLMKTVRRSGAARIAAVMALCLLAVYVAVPFYFPGMLALWEPIRWLAYVFIFPGGQLAGLVLLGFAVWLIARAPWAGWARIAVSVGAIAATIALFIVLLIVLFSDFQISGN